MGGQDAVCTPDQVVTVHMPQLRSSPFERGGKRAGDAAYSEGSSLYRSGEQQLEHLQSRAEQMSHQAKDKVRQEPALALATALGVGAGIALLIGIVTSRK